MAGKADGQTAAHTPEAKSGPKVWRRKRSTSRSPARLTLRVHGAGHVAEAITCDVSRTGARVRFRIDDLGLDRELGLFDLGKELMEMFGEVFATELRNPKDVRMVQKGMKPIRIGTVWRTAGEIDVGCRFLEPLTETEQAILGLRLID